jgi:hypothetical protein
MTIGSRDRFEGPVPDRSNDDYFVIRVGFTCFQVSAATAAAVMAALARRWPPRWVGFVDLHGSRIRLRSHTIAMIYESSAVQRQHERDFERARRLEEKADRRPWEDDEDD